MNQINIIIDGQPVTCSEGETILEAADQAGIHIPRLCHQEGLKPSGNCRVCVVEIEGYRTLVGSCHTPAAEGMVIKTRSSQIDEARKVNLELMLAGHTGTCATDIEARECGLHKLAAELEVGPPKFNMKQPRFHAVEQNPYVLRDMAKCILCRKCVRACEEIAGQNVYSIGYRGFSSKVIVDCDIPLNKDVCKDCGICIEFCPTSALLWPEGVKRRRDFEIKSTTKSESSEKSQRRASLLATLESRQRQDRYISEHAVAEIAEKLGLTQSEVFGVASFYAFLSTKQQGKNVIRVCNSLPCHLGESQMIIDSIQQSLGIKPGETTSDGSFSFELTNCIGACDQAPAMLINDELYGNLTSSKITEILNSYQK